MKLAALHDTSLLLEQYRANCKAIMLESTYNMSPSQLKSFNCVYVSLYPLLEATLTASQVEKVIDGLVAKQTAQQQSTAVAPAGKIAQTVADIQSKVNRLKDQIQQSEPVKDFDAKFERLKTQISQKLGNDSKIKTSIQSIGQYAKENPRLTSAAIAVLTIAASLAGGPFAAAAAASLLTSSIELFKGQKLSSAVGKGLTAGATGLLTAAGMSLLGSALAEPMKIIASSINPEIAALDYTKMTLEVGDQFKSELGNLEGGMVVGNKEDLQELKAIWDSAISNFQSDNFAQAEKEFIQAREIANYMASDSYVERIVGNDQVASSLTKGSEAVKNFFDALSHVAQGAASGKVSNESANVLSSSQINEAIVLLSEKIDVGALLRSTVSTLKTTAAKAKHRVAKTTNSVEKVTAAWKKANSPTDSNAFGDFLVSLGFSEDDVNSLYSELQIEKYTPSKKTVSQSDLISQIQKAMAKLTRDEVEYLRYYYLEKDNENK